MTIAATYRRLLRAPGVSFLLATSLVARLPAAMVNLAIILRVAHGTGSYAKAGAVTAVYVLGTATGVPLLGRLADRVGRRPVLATAAGTNAASLAVLALLPLHDVALVYLVAAVAGASLPPVAPAVRSLWSELVGDELRSSLYAMDATLQETMFMVGPALVALISSLSSPAAALAASGMIGLVGTLAVTSHSATRSERPARSRTVGLALDSGKRPKVRSRALVTLVVMTLLFLTAIVMIEVTVVAFAGRHHAASQAGLLLASWSAGSLTGGLLFGARAARAGARMVGVLMLATAGGFALLMVAPGVAPLYVLLFVAGVAIAPSFSCVYDLVGRVAAPEVSVEAFSWVASAIQLGAAAGAAIGGIMVQDAGTRASMACAAAVGVCTGAIGLFGRRYLAGTPRVLVVEPGSPEPAAG